MSDPQSFWDDALPSRGQLIERAEKAEADLAKVKEKQQEYREKWLTADEAAAQEFERFRNMKAERNGLREALEKIQKKSDTWDTWDIADIARDALAGGSGERESCCTCEVGELEVCLEELSHYNERWLKAEAKNTSLRDGLKEAIMYLKEEMVDDHIISHLEGKLGGES